MRWHQEPKIPYAQKPSQLPAAPPNLHHMAEQTGAPQGPDPHSSLGRALSPCRNLQRAVGVLPAPSICRSLRFLALRSLRRWGGHGASPSPPTPRALLPLPQVVGKPLLLPEWPGQALGWQRWQRAPRVESSAERSLSRAEPRRGEGSCRIPSHRCSALGDSWGAFF